MNEGTIDIELRELGASFTPGRASKESARALLLQEIEAETSGAGASKPRKRRRWWQNRTLAIAAALVIPGSLAVASEVGVDIPVFSDGDGGYFLEPRSPGATDGTGGGQVTEGDLALCREQRRNDAVDPACALILEADRAGELEPIPGPPGERPSECQSGRPTRAGAGCDD